MTTRRFRFYDRYGHQITSDPTLEHFTELFDSIAGTGLYGELDRAVAGLLPLRQLPVEQHRTADYSTLEPFNERAYPFER